MEESQSQSQEEKKASGAPAAGGTAKPPTPKPAPSAGAAKPAAAKPAGKPAAKPGAKPAVEKKPLVDNGDGTITDPNTGLMWKKEDAWLETKRFYTWPQHQEYVDQVNKAKFAGYSDWRIPTKAEAATLFDKTKQNPDKNGTLVPLDPIFTPGFAANTWISECTDDKIVRFDFKIGSDIPYPPTEIWSSMRLVRKPEAADAKPAEETSTPATKPDANPPAKPAPQG